MAVSGFRLRARLDVSIPCSSPGQRGITPAFGYSAPHPSAEGTLTPMIHALPSAHYDPVRLPLTSPSKSGVEAATLLPDGSPPITRITFPTCRVHYPGGPNGCMCRLLPRPCCLPRFAGGSASASLLSRPSQASLALRPVGSLNRPRRPLSRGFDPAGYPTEPLVSYQSNRQLSGWNLPPLVTRAFGAHTKIRRVQPHRRPPRVQSHAQPGELLDAMGTELNNITVSTS